MKQKKTNKEERRRVDIEKGSLHTRGRTVYFVFFMRLEIKIYVNTPLQCC